MGATLLALPLLGKAPRGDGHPVIVFPGLAAGDLTTLPLRRFLSECGYEVHAWEQGLNFGPRRGVMEACLAQVKRLRERYGRKVSLVGWSLGGVYAREIAKLLPDEVRSVVTLGSPFAGGPGETNAWRAYRWLSGEATIDPERFAALRNTPPVPTTSIFSRSDGIVAWQCSLEREGPQSENIEVHASHMGMAANPLVLYAVADRMAQPEGQWQRFDRNKQGVVKNALYRDPQRRDAGLAVRVVSPSSAFARLPELAVTRSCQQRRCK
jgi:pimeloyl-ACP methyl ester carboxylesterase